MYMQLFMSIIIFFTNINDTFNQHLIIYSGYTYTDIDIEYSIHICTVYEHTSVDAVKWLHVDI